jgi:hypothetical protein
MELADGGKAVDEGNGGKFSHLGAFEADYWLAGPRVEVLGSIFANLRQKMLPTYILCQKSAHYNSVCFCKPFIRWLLVGHLHRKQPLIGRYI